MERHRSTPTRRHVLGAALAAIGIPLPFSRAGAIEDSDSDIAGILGKASQTLADVDTLHFTLDVDGDTFIEESGSIRLVSAEGDLARPDKVAVEFKVNLFGAGTVSIRMITIGEDSWTTDLITGNWGDAPPEFGYNPSVLYDNQEGLGPVMGKLDNGEITGTEEVDDEECHRVTGSARNEVISPLTAGTMTGENVGIELWIGIETSNLRRVKVIEPESNEKEHPATWELNLSGFNEKVTIEPPD